MALGKKEKDKLTAGKKATKSANTKKLNNEAKKAVQKVIMETAAAMPYGQANRFLALNVQLDQIESEMAALNLRKRGVHAGFKELKVELRALSRVRKLRKMEPADVRSLKATEALYEQQLSMTLSEEQKEIIADLKEKRAKVEANIASGDGNSGKEIGSDAAVQPSGDDEPVEMSKVPVPELPKKNEQFSALPKREFVSAPATTH